MTAMERLLNTFRKECPYVMFASRANEARMFRDWRKVRLYIKTKRS